MKGLMTTSMMYMYSTIVSIFEYEQLILTLSSLLSAHSSTYRDYFGKGNSFQEAPGTCFHKTQLDEYPLLHNFHAERRLRCTLQVPRPQCCWTIQSYIHCPRVHPRQCGQKSAEPIKWTDKHTSVAFAFCFEGSLSETLNLIRFKVNTQ